jgi:hypothetical protein
MKICSRCKTKKDLTQFYKEKSRKDGYGMYCKECEKEYKKQYYLNNKEQFKKYKLENKDYINKSNNIRQKNRRLIDPLFKLSGNIRALIRLSIKGSGYTKKSKTNKILGCSYEEFKIYLEGKFTKGMNWENQGFWELDHIYPVSRANDEEHLIKLNHYTNFQPLWKDDNRKKGNKIL